MTTDGAEAESGPADNLTAGASQVRRQQVLHDLRNSLYAIRNGLEILQAGCSADERTAMVIQMMQAEESRATRLLQEYEQQTSA